MAKDYDRSIIVKLTKKQSRKRLLMMIFGAFAIFFTGYPHVWSVYQPYMMEMAGWSKEQASMCFYLALGFLVFGNIVGGRIQDRHNPRMTIVVGGGIFAAGVILSAFLIMPSPLPLYLTYGIMQGFGQGMIYTTIISTAQKWFPGRTGFASGIVVAANGLCGFFLAPVSRRLLETGGPEFAFLVIGIVIAISWILCSIFFNVPKENPGQETQSKISGEKGNVSENQKQYTSKEMMRTKAYYLMLATMLFGLLPYFLMSPVSQIHQIEIGIPSSIAVSAVTFGSVVNAGTRLILPAVSDKVGRIVCVKGVLVVSVAAMAVLTLAGSGIVTAAIIAMYGCYGGIMGSFPSLTSAVFGMEHSGENYGYVMLGVVMASFGAPAITGIVTGRGYGMQMVFMIGTVCAAAALGFIWLLKKELEKQA